jgi:hypothetical protein
MGDRAIVVFTSGEGEKADYSPGVYVHWSGSAIPEMLKKAAPSLRKGDPSYAAARFCGFCHTMLEGSLGLGLFDAPTKEDIADNFQDYSHGDNGVFIVDIDTGKVVIHDNDSIKPFKLPELFKG